MNRKHTPMFCRPVAIDASALAVSPSSDVSPESFPKHQVFADITSICVPWSLANRVKTVLSNAASKQHRGPSWTNWPQGSAPTAEIGISSFGALCELLRLPVSFLSLHNVMKYSMKRIIFPVVATIAIVLATGCASYTAPVDVPEASISPKKMAEARHAVSTMLTSARLGEEVAMASANVCLHQAKRLPYIVLTNPQFRDHELRSAYLKAGLTENVKLFAVSSAASAFDGRFITKVGGEPTAMGQPDLAYIAALKLAKAGKPVQLDFSDGTTATIPTQMGCGGLTIVVPGTGHPSNWGIGVELVSVDWMSLAAHRDESMFVLGRSLYFSSDAGAKKLNDALYQGASLNGVAIGLTFGLSMLIGDAKNGMNALARSRNAKAADEFGMRAAVRAGADPTKILAFVRRMNAKKDLIWDEMRFADDRIPALETVAGELSGIRLLTQASPTAQTAETDISNPL